MALGSSLKRIILSLAGERAARELRRQYLARAVARRPQLHEAEMRVLPKLLGEGDVALDVGANVGLYTRYMSDLVGKTGRIWAFEPVLDNYEILVEVVRRARLGNVEARKLALGRSAGQGNIVIPASEQMEGYYQAHLTADSAETGRREEVEVVSLDSLFEKNESADPAFIKCDVEGGELDVLEGGAGLLERARPTMLIEVSRGTSEDCFRFLADRGYRAFVFDGTGCRPTPHYLHHEFSNYFFAHHDSSAAAVLSDSAPQAVG